MLSIAKLASPEYYRQEPNYYAEGGEAVSVWLGRARGHLGLLGPVEEAPLKALYEGCDPRDAEKHLVQNAASPSRQAGWDLTFSAPKSVSIVWALASAAIRQQIAECHRRAVVAALDYVEDEAAFSRRGKAGKDLDTCHLIVAAFEHASTRAGDPDLHTHCLVLNVGLRDDQTCGTLVSRKLYRAKMTAGAIYRAELAHQLKKHLGFAIRPVKRWFELEAIPKPLIWAFSQRRQAIVREGGHTMSAAEAARVARETRQPKRVTLQLERNARWREQAKQEGFHAEKIVPQMVGSSRGQREVKLQVVFEEVLECLTGLKNTEKPTRSQHYIGQMSHFSESDLVRSLAEATTPLGIAAREVREFVKQRLQDLEGLSTEESVEPRFTTKGMLELERKIFAAAQSLHETKNHRVDLDDLKKPLRRLNKKQPFTPEQLRAILHLTRETGDLALLSGFPGTGKTSVLKACQKAWKRAGYQVLGASLAGKAALELQLGSGIESKTLHKRIKLHDATFIDALRHHLSQLGRAARKKKTWRYHVERITAKTVVVIDEAGMLSTREFEALVSRVREVGAKLVLVGDPNQIPPIGPGSPFRALLEKYEKAHLEEIQRQREPWARDAAKLISQGKMVPAFELFAEHGRIAQLPEQRVYDQLVQDWSKHALKEPRSVLIFAVTNEEVQKLNTLCQAARRKARWLPNWPSVKIGGNRFFAGDRVQFTQNHDGLGVRNGDLGTVKSINPLKREMRIQMDRKVGLLVKMRRTVNVPLQHFKSIELGYALTTHKGQGQTIDKAFVLLGGQMVSQELTLVQATRAREFTEFYVNTTTAGLDLAAFAKKLSQPQQTQGMAVEVQQRELAALQEALNGPTTAKTEEPPRERVSGLEEHPQEKTRTPEVLSSTPETEAPQPQSRKPLRLEPEPHQRTCEQLENVSFPPRTPELSPQARPHSLSPPPVEAADILKTPPPATPAALSSDDSQHQVKAPISLMEPVLPTSTPGREAPRPDPEEMSDSKSSEYFANAMPVASTQEPGRLNGKPNPPEGDPTPSAENSTMRQKQSDALKSPTEARLAESPESSARWNDQQTDSTSAPPQDELRKHTVQIDANLKRVENLLRAEPEARQEETGKVPGKVVPPRKPRAPAKPLSLKLESTDEAKRKDDPGGQRLGI